MPFAFKSSSCHFLANYDENKFKNMMLHNASDAVSQKERAKPKPECGTKTFDFSIQLSVLKSPPPPVPHTVFRASCCQINATCDLEDTCT